MLATARACLVSTDEPQTDTLTGCPLVTLKEK